MASVTELKMSRDLSVNQIKATCAKLEAALTNRNLRLVQKYVIEVQDVFKSVELKHLQYMTAAKKTADDPQEISFLIDTDAMISDVVDRAELFIEEQTAFQKKERAEKRLEDGYNLQVSLLESNMKSVKDRMVDLHNKVNNNALLDMEMLVDEIKTIQRKADDSLKSFVEKVGILEDNEKLLNAVQRRNKEEVDVGQRVLELKQAANNKGVSTPSSISQALSRSSSPQRVTGSSVMKTKKLEFPRFSGDIRAYTVFKKDFKEMVADTGAYTDTQLSHILRSECLQGEPRNLCRNILSPVEIWARLDDVYHDPQKLVEMITRQVSEYKKIGDKDYAGFIKFVDNVEKAHLDLSAMGNLTVMDNPMTCRVIEIKCPEWIQVALTAKKTENPDSGDTFSFLLEFLRSKRREARKLAALREAEMPKYHDKKKGQVNLVDTKKQGQDPAWKCLVPTCAEHNKHFLSNCSAWKALDPNNKGNIVADKKLCVLCFSPQHMVSSCPKKSKWKKCDVDDCNKWHSRMIHGASVKGLVLSMNNFSKDRDHHESASKVWLLVQDVEDGFGNEIIKIMWDSGATVSLITFEYAEKCNLAGSCCEFELTTVNGRLSKINTKLYQVPLVDRSGELHYIHAYGIEKISSYMHHDIPMDFVKNVQEYVRGGELKVLSGQVDLLIGMTESNIHPEKIFTYKKMGLYQSLFGTGFIFAGGSGNLDEESIGEVNLIHDKSKMPDFLTAEGLGVEIPKRCKSCKQCKECSFKAFHLSWQENIELKAIEDGLTLDVTKKRWLAEYPFKVNPSVLVNNKVQALALMKGLEKRLVKNKMIEDFNVQFQDTIDRGVFCEVKDDKYDGPIFYVSLVDAYKSGDHVTTPIRLCMNSSLKYAGHSLNDLMMKGPPALNDLFGVLLGFRVYKIAFVKDLNKFYQSIDSCERDQHLRRVLWRFGDVESEPKEYITTKVNFGDKCAGAVSQVSLRRTAQMFKVIDHRAADMIVEKTYVDDTLGGGDNKEDAIHIAKKMDEIVEKGGFSYKKTIMSGDRPDTSEENMKILGIGWDTCQDELYIDAKINFGEKIKGRKNLPDIDPCNVVADAPLIITKRMIWRVALGQFDALGLTSPFLLRLKIMMRELVQDENVKEWDSPVSDKYREKFLTLISNLAELKKLRFPRCIVPRNMTKENKVDLMMFSDGSRLASCALGYARWTGDDGEIQCVLLAGKTRVAPVRRISIPRMELQGALMATRLAESIQEFLDIKFKKRYFFTDSSAVLGMLKGNLSTYLEFVSTRVSEIKSKTDTDTEWKWTPSDWNIADVGTRDSVEPADLDGNSRFQKGMSWMTEKEDTWPALKEPTWIPAEEMVKESRKVMTFSQTDQVLDFSRYKSFSFAVNVMMNVNKAKKLFLFMIKKEDEILTPLEEKKKAQEFIFLTAQKDVRQFFHDGKFLSLRARLVAGEHVDEGIVVVSGRLGDNLSIGYDKQELPLLSKDGKVSTLIMKEAHAKFHSGVDKTIHISRQTAWIVRAGHLAKLVIKNCAFCKIKNKIVQHQIMAPLPAERISPAPVFFNTSVDLFGPFKIRDSVKRRSTRDGYGMIFCCLASTAIHLEVLDDYSTDSALQAIRRFMCYRGTPASFLSDPGTQLKAAGSALKSWDCDKIQEFLKQKSIAWNIIPTNAQHCNGLAESMIKSTKSCLKQVAGESVMSKGEVDTLFAEVMHLVNSRPLKIKAGSDPDSMCPITPNHLMLGRATVEVPDVKFDEKPSLAKRLRFIEDVKKQFWNKWFIQVFPKLIPSSKWNVQKRNVQVDDIVLLKEESKLQSTYKRGKVVQAHPDSDGKVRRVMIEYINILPDQEVTQARKMRTERSVHKIIVLSPAKNTSPDDEKSPTATCRDGGSVK